MFIRFDRMYERDRQTDTHRRMDTAWWHGPRLHSIAGQSRLTATLNLTSVQRWHFNIMSRFICRWRWEFPGITRFIVPSTTRANDSRTHVIESAIETWPLVTRQCLNVTRAYLLMAAFKVPARFVIHSQTITYRYRRRSLRYVRAARDVDTVVSTLNFVIIIWRSF